jgi:phospholipid transport system substrate-binding protein
MQAPDAFVAQAAAEIAREVAARGAALRTDAALQAELADTVLRPRFDLAKSCELMLRPYWTAAAPETRARVVEAFYGYLLRTYGDTLHAFRDDTVRVLPGQPPALTDRYQVHTVLRLHDGREFRVQFYLRGKAGQWYVVDVIVDGVSYLRTYGSDFGPIVRAEGLDGLVAWLDGPAASRE